MCCHCPAWNSRSGLARKKPKCIILDKQRSRCFYAVCYIHMYSCIDCVSESLWITRRQATWSMLRTYLNYSKVGEGLTSCINLYLLEPNIKKIMVKIALNKSCLRHKLLNWKLNSDLDVLGNDPEVWNFTFWYLSWNSWNIRFVMSYVLWTSILGLWVQYISTNKEQA